MKKILIIADKEPISSRMPGNPRLYELFNSLSSSYELHLIIINKKYKVLELYQSSYRIFTSILAFNFLNVREGLLAKVVRYLLAIPGDRPGLTDRVKMINIQERIDGVLEYLQPDYIYIDGLSASYFVSKSMLRKSHIDLCDSIAKLKYRESTQSKQITRRIALLQEAFGIYVRELYACWLAKSISFISEEEITLYDKIGRDKLFVLPQGVSNEEFLYKPLHESSQDLLFFGALDYTPNEDAALWLSREIFPKIRSVVPGIKLKIVGKAPSPELLSSASDGGIDVFPNVPSMAEHIHGSLCIIVPLRIGAGVKNKILIAALAGRPIIASRLALEGMPEYILENVFPCDSDADYVNAVKKIVQSDKANLNKMLWELSEKVKYDYTWQNSALRLEAIFKN